jgi:hypothetical protein
MDQQPAQRRAALTGGAHRPERHRAQRQVEIRRRRDDRGIVAAELEDRLAEAARDALADRPPHPGRSGRRDQGHAGIVDQRFADLAAADDQGRQPSGASSPNAAQTRAASALTANAVSGAFSEGFQITLSPQTKANAAFQLHTATGKLNAEITPTGPSGCHCSVMRWSRRSEGMHCPCNCRESPTAKSQMSIISWTSPRPSERILPTSIDTKPAEIGLGAAQFFAQQPHEFAAARCRHLPPCKKRLFGAAISRSTSASVVSRTCASVSPVIGERTVSDPPSSRAASTPRRSKKRAGFGGEVLGHD